MTARRDEHPSAWRILPIAFLRQAGFPIDLLDALRSPRPAALAENLLAAREAEEAARTVLRDHVQHLTEPLRQQLLTRLGQGRELRSRQIRALSEQGEAVGEALRHWQSSCRRRDETERRLRSEVQAQLDAGRSAVVRAFQQDRLLRDALLLSNDSAYALFSAWLTEENAVTGASERGRADTLARYLQRFCTKNETHSHFGPFTPARFTDTPGIDWSAGHPLERHPRFTYWAAHAIARLAGADSALRDFVRPRRAPLTFVDGDVVARHEFATDAVQDFDNWHYRQVDERTLDPLHRWILDHSDGTHDIATLRASCPWGPRHAGDPAAFDDALDELTAGGLVIAEFGIPSGTEDALRDLRQALPAQLPDAKPYLELIDALQALLVEFATAPLKERPRLLERLKEEFTRGTGQSPNRGQGEIYQDRSVLYEECRSGLRDLAIGPEVAAFLEQDMAIAYEMAMIRPRLRIQRETRILHDWCVQRYGTDAEVPLVRLYADFFADTAQLRRHVAEVDRELAEVGARIRSVLLGPDREARSVEVDAAAVQRLIDDYESWPSALLNPDVMFIAKDVQNFRDGDFAAVVGDCHAVRDLLTHTSVAPLIQQEFDEFARLVTEHYTALVDEDEIVVDIVRGHANKTSAVVPLAVPDLEVAGLSPKDREQVISHDSLFLRVTADRLELRAAGRPQRLRLMAAPAGTASIIGDPLAVFAFPRQFGGGFLPVDEDAHIPRLTCGRVVLQREQWRLPAATVTGDLKPGDDAADFLAAQLVRRRLGLPDQVFAKVASQPKPVYVDWDSPLLVRQFYRMVRTDGGPVVISEMLPGPDALWLRQNGQAHTSELRCTLFSTGRAA